jgi:uncharacterized membrane protein YfcA
MATIISYALFMAMGMPINIANATTRIGVLAQFSVTSAVFRKEGYLDLRLATKVGIPVGHWGIFGSRICCFAAHQPNRMGHWKRDSPHSPIALCRQEKGSQTVTNPYPIPI